MKLSQYAKQQGISYSTALRWWHSGVIRGYQALSEGAMAPMPYLLGIHQLADERFHAHVEIQAIGRAPGKLKYAASSESLWGLWTNDSLPAQKAQELRAAVARSASDQS